MRKKRRLVCLRRQSGNLMSISYVGNTEQAILWTGMWLSGISLHFCSTLQPRLPLLRISHRGGWQTSAPVGFEQTQKNQSFTADEVIGVLRQLPKGKSSGPDGVYYEQWLRGGALLVPHLCNLFNQILAVGHIPCMWHHARLSLLFKGKNGDDVDDLNLYRGIASERTLKKIFCKLVVERVASTVEKALPPEQFGFRRGRGTQDAIHVLLSEVERTLACKGGHLYAVFIDCVKAFDRAPRRLLVDSFQRAGVCGPLLKVLSSFFADDTLSVDLGTGVNVHITQNVGTPQGNPLSCMSFSLLLADLPHIVREEFRNALVVLYADDIVVAHRDLGAIKRIVPLVVDFLRSKGLEVNTRKTKAMKFRRGGRLAAADKIVCNGQPLEFVNSFSYLGLLVHFKGTTFTQHVKRRVKATLAAMYVGTKDVRKLSLSAATKLFALKAVPMMSYSLGRVWKYLSLADFRLLEGCFCTYMKRVLCLSMTARSRFVYLLADCGPIMEAIRSRLKAPITESFSQFLSEWCPKVAEATEEVGLLDVFLLRDLWFGRACSSRHVYTRYIVHGYHHLVCSFPEYHQAGDLCLCKFCSQKCAKYHVSLCPQLDSSLHFLSRLGGEGLGGETSIVRTA